MSDEPQREPDGVPHDIVGRTAFVSLVLAFAGVAMLAWEGWLGLVIFAALAIPATAIALSRKSAREREQEPPSR